MDEGLAYQNGFATGYSAGYAAARRLPSTCSVEVFDMPSILSDGLINPHKTVTWAPNNTEYADGRFQYGVDYWMHRFLQRNELKGESRVSFLPIYYSYIHIFYPHLKPRAKRRVSKAPVRDRERVIVPHTHPGSCDSSTSGMIRLVVDTDLCPSTRHIPVPYVVSHPSWLVAAHLSLQPRTTFLYFKGHLPRAHIDRSQTRYRLLQALQGEPGVHISAANSLRDAEYTDHEAYVRRLHTAVFCLSPRGDTASSKRMYEALAAGCIPVIVADRLRLPFERQLDWTRLSMRFTEAEARNAPLSILTALRNVSHDRIRAMQAYVSEKRDAFLWHDDVNRLSAMSYVLHEMCAWQDV